MKLPESILKQAARYMHDKSYDQSLVDPARLTQAVVSSVIEPDQVLSKGDRIRLLETNQVGLVYAMDA